MLSSFRPFMAQSWRVKSRAPRKPRPPLDGEALERLAIFYVGRYATTRAKLARYLQTKLASRGWSAAGDPPIASIVERMAAAGYVDDSAYAEAKTASLQRRGYGERRVTMALRAAGIAEQELDDAREAARSGSMQAALAFARRRGLGPYAQAMPDRDQRNRAFAAMMRAGHSSEIVRKILDCAPGETPDEQS